MIAVHPRGCAAPDRRRSSRRRDRRRSGGTPAKIDWLRCQIPAGVPGSGCATSSGRRPQFPPTPIGRGAGRLAWPNSLGFAEVVLALGRNNHRAPRRAMRRVNFGYQLDHNGPPSRPLPCCRDASPGRSWRAHRPCGPAPRRQIPLDRLANQPRAADGAPPRQQPLLRPAGGGDKTGEGRHLGHTMTSHRSNGSNSSSRLSRHDRISQPNSEFPGHQCVETRAVIGDENEARRFGMRSNQSLSSICPGLRTRRGSCPRTRRREMVSTGTSASSASCCELFLGIGFSCRKQAAIGDDGKDRLPGRMSMHIPL